MDRIYINDNPGDNTPMQNVRKHVGEMLLIIANTYPFDADAWSRDQLLAMLKMIEDRVRTVLKLTGVDDPDDHLSELLAGQGLEPGPFHFEAFSESEK